MTERDTIAAVTLTGNLGPEYFSRLQYLELPDRVAPGRIFDTQSVDLPIYRVGVTLQNVPNTIKTIEHQWERQFDATLDFSYQNKPYSALVLGYTDGSPEGLLSLYVILDPLFASNARLDEHQDMLPNS